MKVSYSTLKRFISQLNCPVEAIVNVLTSQGFVIESLTRSDEIFSTDLFGATIVNRKAGITSDICTVKIGESLFDIKCEKWGAPKPGQRVLLNRVGESISTQPLRDQRIPEKEDFFITLPENVREGEAVFSCLVGDDWVFDIEITANRGDCMSLLGLAREVAAGLDLDCLVPHHHLSDSEFDWNFQVFTSDPDLCPFYSGRQVKNLTIKPSPWWIIRELYLMGFRPINQVVDITNLVMMEFGQPLHAFDANLIANQKIEVRRAKNSESLTTLDGVERKLKNTMLVIADSSHPIAIAGIMGGYQSEVSPTTRDIILEAAIFQGVQVRKTAREVGLRTEASSRFERGVDPGAVLAASERALYLLLEDDPSIAIARDWMISGEAMVPNSEIEFSPAWIDQVMNCEIDPEVMRKIMTKLGFFQLSPSNEKSMRVRVPSWRPDVLFPIDCAEEIGRIYGYEHIVPRLPGFSFDPGNAQREFVLEETLRHYLRDRGLKESVSLSLTSQANCDKLTLPATDYIRVQNPLSQDHVILRPDLIITALDVLKTNVARGRENFGFFECGEVFTPGTDDDHPYREERRLVVVLNGHYYPSFWQKPSQVDLYYMKGLAENLLELIGYPVLDVKWQPIGTDPYFDPVLSFHGTNSTGKELLRGGLLKKSVGEAFEFWGDHFCLEMPWESLLRHLESPSFHLQKIIRYPSIRRDVSLVVDQNRSWEEIESMVKQIVSSSNLPIEIIELFDSYQGGHLPPGKKTFSFSMVFRSSQRTLTDGEVDGWIGVIKTTIKPMPGIVLREDLAGGI